MNFNLARFSVNRPVAAGIISAAILVLGLFFLKSLPVSLYPDVSLPFVSVGVALPGASPEQIESRIVKPLEKELAGAKGVKRIISSIRPGFGLVVVGFNMDVAKQTAIDSVREKVQTVRPTFPQDAKDPMISAIDLGATPVLIYGIESRKSPEATKKLLDDGLIRTLQKTDGVKEAAVVGLGEEQVEITLDPAKLSALRIAPLDVYQQLKTDVASVPWGDVQQSGNLLSVTRATLPKEASYWDDYSISLADGRTVRLSEIGTARSVRDADAASVRINGKAGLGLVVTKRAGANTMETVQKVEQQIARLGPVDGVKLFKVIDQSTYIHANTHEVWIALFLGGAFAVLVILFFLTDVKSAIITATALPVSVAGTFILMHYLGFSINMMSLLALALAIGLLIDDAVVVREAIFSETSKGKSAREAAVSGTDKVASAVLATTLAVVAVFLPVSAMKGMVGQFFKEFGLTIVAAVIFSLWVAFTLDPMLSAKFGGEHKPLAGRFWDSWRALLDRSEEGARKLAAWAFARPVLVISGAVLLLIISSALLLSRGADFLSFEDRGELIVDLATPSGSTKEATLKLADEAQARLTGLEGLKNVYVLAGGDDKTKAEMRLIFTDKTERKTGLSTLEREVNTRLQGLNGEFLVLDPPPVEGVGAEAPIAIYVYGDDFKQMFAEADKLVAAINKIPGVAKVHVETARHSPGINIQLDPNQLGYWGTNASAVGLTGRLALTGLEAGSVGDDNTPLYVRYAQNQRTLESLWSDTYVPTPKGPVPLGTLAKSAPGSSPARIDRERRSRKVVIWGAMDHTRSYGLVLKDISQVLQSVPAPLSAQIGGDKDMFDEMTSNFSIAIAGSAFFIFIILAIQFENLMRPFVILLTLPLAAIGAFLALYLAGQQLALGSLIGIVLLIGLAAKNGILLVDAIGAKEKAMSLFDAVTGSVRERFRPILMTSVAMIFGMIPTAVMRGAGSEFRAPMAIAIIGGVVSSTLLSVLIVPAIFGLIARFRARKISGSDDAKLTDQMSAAFVKAAQTALPVLLVFLTFGAASPAKAGDAVPAMPRADMRQVAHLINGTLPTGSKESLTIQAADEVADGLTVASREAFLGGLKLEADREWSKPGYSQALTLPLPAQLGGPQTTEMVVVPEVQNTLTAGWSLPLFNMQAIQGLKFADLTSDQRDLVVKLQRETAAETKAQLLLQYEMAVESVSVQDERVRIATARLTEVEQRIHAGLARPLLREEAEAALESAQAERGQVQAQLAQYRARFRLESGLDLPATGLGLTQFPVMVDRPFAPMALAVLSATERIKAASADLVDAGYYPTVDLTLAREIKQYEPEAPPAQNVVGLKATWLLLDAGSRRHNLADAKRGYYEAAAHTAGVRTQLQAAYDSLKERYQGAQYGLKASQAAYRAAARADEDAVAAFASGSARLIDVRNADDAKLKAQLGVYRAETQMQALAVESLVLSGHLLDYLGQAG